jgi:hypothetical protein
MPRARIFDSAGRIKVEVTSATISKSLRCSSSRCPISDSIKQQIVGCSRVQTDLVWIAWTHAFAAFDVNSGRSSVLALLSGAAAEVALFGA